MVNKKERCQVCKYWDEIGKDKQDCLVGCCRINPPIITLSYNIIKEINTPFFGHFPQTFKDDWCGKFEAKEEAKQE